MGLFNKLMSKIFGHASAPAGPANTATTPPATGAAASSTNAPSAIATGQPATVDVTAILDRLAANNPEHLDWKKSIVDLMKLVGMDSGLGARKELAKELGYAGDPSDSATMNIWLHKQVLKKLAENGGKVPPELLD